MRRPGIKPGSRPWQGRILSLYYRRWSLCCGPELAPSLQGTMVQERIVGQNGVSTEAMAQWQRVGFQTQRLGVRIPLASFFFPLLRVIKTKKKRDAETGNRTQAAAATTRSPATRLFRQSPGIGGSGYRSRFSTLRRLYATMYKYPPHRLRPSGFEPESYPWKG